MGDDLFDYIREREQACRVRASLCIDSGQGAAWLERATEWAALADEIHAQRKAQREVAPLFVEDTRRAWMKIGNRVDGKKA